MFIVRFFNKKLFFVLLFAISFSAEIKPSCVPTQVARRILATGLITGYSLLVGTGILALTISSLSETFENKLIEQWIIQNNLNCYGEPKDTVYEQGSPLEKHETRFTYLKRKFPKNPWFKGYKDILARIGSVRTVNAGIAILGGLLAMGCLTIGDACVIANTSYLHY